VFKSGGRVAGIPPWWRSFVFHVLNGRQLSVYLYLLTLMGDDGYCSPTTREIAVELGLMGATMVFDAMNVLETSGFILRSRNTAVSASGARRNLYQRPSAEFTVLHLLRSKRMRSHMLSEEGARELLGIRYQHYAVAAPGDRAAAMIALLQESLAAVNLGTSSA
jgi:hypothetical protein